jgi:seryl-tRNA synthetase
MIPIQQIRQESAALIDRLSKRGRDFSSQINQVLVLDEEKRICQKEQDDLLARANALSKEVGIAFQQGDKLKAEDLKSLSVSLKTETKTLELKAKNLSDELTQLLYSIPNAPHESVPTGKDAESNEEVFSRGQIPNLGNNALPHWELATKYNLIDFELGNKITGAGFPVYTGKGARLQRALINYFLDKAHEAGYMEVQVPLLVNEASGTGTGQLPDKEGQMYHVQLDQLYLIPTAEVPITNIYRDVILNESDLPIKNMGYTPCFRREAGSYGAHVRGLNRLHQFDKVEIVQIAKPSQSYHILNEMVEHVKSLVSELNLPFRVLKLCGGDMGFASALTYDFEVFSAAQEKWLEVSSVSNFESFQSNRLKLRYKNSEGKNELAHTLNGSAMALPRIVAALLENNQTSDGILIPQCLVPYTGFSIITN